MPKKHHVGSLSKTGPQFSRKASGRKNAEHQSVGLSYAAARPSPDYNRLRDVEQVPFPDLCSWGEKTCKKFLWDHGVLSADVPRCWVCGEERGENFEEESSSNHSQTSGGSSTENFSRSTHRFSFASHGWIADQSKLRNPASTSQDFFLRTPCWWVHFVHLSAFLGLG